MKKNPHQLAAIALVKKLEQERAGRSLMLGKVVKTQSTTPVVLAAEPELQAAFVEYVVEFYAKLGTPKGTRVTEWFRNKSVPTASAEVVRLLLRRELPFTDDMLAGMLEKLAKVNFLSLVEFTEQLGRALEKFVAKNGCSPRLRKAAERFADVIAIRNFPPQRAKYWKEECGFPGALDRKIAARIDQLLAH